MTYTPINPASPLVDRVRAIVSRHVGKDNRIERRCLVAMLPEGDRAVRDAISECPEICSTRKGGYFVAANQTEVNDFRKELWGQISGTIRRAKDTAEYYKQHFSRDINYKQETLLEV